MDNRHVNYHAASGWLQRVYSGLCWQNGNIISRGRHIDAGFSKIHTSPANANQLSLSNICPYSCSTNSNAYTIPHCYASPTPKNLSAGRGGNLDLG